MLPVRSTGQCFVVAGVERRRRWPPSHPLPPRHGSQQSAPSPLLLLLLLLLGLGAARGTQQQHPAPRPKDVFPEDMGPVKLQLASPSRPSAAATYTNLELVYEDYRTIKTRPLFHLEPNGLQAESPQLMLFSAFLDTRPMYYGKSSVLRMMALKYEPQDTQTLDVYCKYLVEGDDRFYVSKAHGPLRVNTNPQDQSPYRDVIYSCSTTIHTVAEVEAAAAGGPKLLLPKFATLVRTPEQDVPHDMAWVHVRAIPLVYDRAREVNAPLLGGRETQGPFLTPGQYHAGDGEVGVCMGPMFNGDYGAGAIAEWAEYNKLQGVTKVHIYDYSMGFMSRVFANLYQTEELFEVYEVMLSKRLLKPGSEGDTARFCGDRFQMEPKRGGHTSREWFTGAQSDGCAGLAGQFKVFLHAESALRMHCTHSMAGRYRWVAVIDLDEYIVPRINPAVDWRQLFKLAMEDASTGFAKFGLRPNATLNHPPNEFQNRTQSPFPSAFAFRNTYVCSQCAAHKHIAPFATKVSPQVVVIVPPRPDLDRELRTPRPAMHPVVWSAVRSFVMGPTAAGNIKCISDPLAVMSHFAHTPWSLWDMEGGTLRIPTTREFVLAEEVALLYHVRIATVNSAPKWEEAQDRSRSQQLYELDLCVAPACGGAHDHDHPGVPARLYEDWTIANLYGERLAAAMKARYGNGVVRPIYKDAGKHRGYHYW